MTALGIFLLSLAVLGVAIAVHLTLRYRERRVIRRATQTLAEARRLLASGTASQAK